MGNQDMIMGCEFCPNVRLMRVIEGSVARLNGASLPMGDYYGATQPGETIPDWVARHFEGWLLEATS